MGFLSSASKWDWINSGSHSRQSWRVTAGGRFRRFVLRWLRARAGGKPLHDHMQGSAVRRSVRVRRFLVIAAATGLLATTPVVHADEPFDTLDEIEETVLGVLDDGIVEPRNSGGGDSRGTITYTSTTKLPKAFAGCARNLTFTLGQPGRPEGWMSEAFVFNTVISGFAGPVSMTGHGGSDGNLNCENYSSGAGVLTVSLTGDPTKNPTESKLDCRDDYGDLSKSKSLTGRYTRVFSSMVVILSGRCLVNDYATGPVTFIAEIQAVPGDPVPDDPSGGEGITRSVTTLHTTGTFILVPA